MIHINNKKSKGNGLDYIVTYEFQPHIEQKFKTNIGAILKRSYIDKGLVNRLSKGKLLIDFDYIKDEVIEKLKKNKANIVEIKEFEEFPNSIKNFIASKNKEIKEKSNQKIEVERFDQIQNLKNKNLELQDQIGSLNSALTKKNLHIKNIEVELRNLKEKNNRLKKAFDELYSFFEWIRDNRKKVLKDQRLYVETFQTYETNQIDKAHEGEFN